MYGVLSVWSTEYMGMWACNENVCSQCECEYEYYVMVDSTASTPTICVSF